MTQLSLGRIRPEVLDLALAGGYAVIAAAQLTWGPSVAHPAVTMVATVVLAGCLLARRRAPLAALAIGLATLQVEAATGAVVQVSPFATLVCAYAIGRHSSGARAWWGGVLVAVGVLGFYAATGWSDVSEPISVLCAWLTAWALGLSTRRRLEEEELVRAALRERYVAEERTRIAREVHDIVGHALNVLVVQAGAARLSLDADPATSRALLLEMEDAGRDALTELDDVLGLLRAGGEEPRLQPTGLSQLPELVRRLGGAGLDISLHLEATSQGLPRPVDLAAYRIAQEALTNALKHAGPCHVSVEVRTTGGRLVVEVRDDGRAEPGPAGRGLSGIAERARRCGGTVEVGPVDSGGFRVRADLPLAHQAAR